MGEEKPFHFVRVLFDGVIAGGAAGVIVETVLYPIDTIKTRLQAARVGSKIQLKGLYSGLAGNIAGVLPASAIFVGIYEPTKQKLLKAFAENLSALAHLLDFAPQPGFADSDYVLTVNTVAEKGTFRLLLFPRCAPMRYGRAGRVTLSHDSTDHTPWISLLPTAGAVGGAASSLIRVPAEAQRELNDPENAVIGAFAGAITGAITTPLDVMKTRLMVQGSANQYKGLLNCAQAIVREEGPAALLKGIGPRVLWIGIGGSIFFGVLERTKLLLSQQHSTKASIPETS